MIPVISIINQLKAAGCRHISKMDNPKKGDAVVVADNSSGLAPMVPDGTEGVVIDTEDDNSHDFCIIVRTETGVIVEGHRECFFWAPEKKDQAKTP